MYSFFEGDQNAKYDDTRTEGWYNSWMINMTIISFINVSLNHVGSIQTYKPLQVTSFLVTS